MDPATALASAIENSTKVANTPLFSTVIDKLLGYKISEWNAQGETIKRQILDGYEEAKIKGLGIQYVSAFRSSANLINVGVKATKYVDSTQSNNIEMENDFFWGLLEHSKEISNDEMQELIAKIIAGEYNTPGTYSMSTLQVIKMLGKNELKLFEKISNLLVNINQLPEVLFSGRDHVKILMSKIGLDFAKLQLLQSLGLILPHGMKITVENPEKKNISIYYFDKELVYLPENDNYKKIVAPDYFGLSPVGEQILPHLSPEFNEEYYEWLKNNYKIPQYKLQEN